MGKYNIDVPKKMEAIIAKHMVLLGGVGGIAGLFGPGTDLPFIAGSWIQMTIELAKEAGHEMSKQKVEKITMAVATGLGFFIGGSKVAIVVTTWLTALITGGLSLFVGAAANVTLNTTVTRAYGRAAARFFIQTSKVDNTEMIVKVIIALIGVDLGFTTPDSNLLA